MVKNNPYKYIYANDVIFFKIKIYWNYRQLNFYTKDCNDSFSWNILFDTKTKLENDKEYQSYIHTNQ